MKKKALLLISFVFILMLSVVSPLSAVTWSDYSSAKSRAEAAEKNGQFEKAMEEYNRAKTYAAAMGYDEIAYGLGLRIRAIDPMTSVYAATEDTSSVIRFGAKYEPKSGVYYGRIVTSDESDTHANDSITSIYVDMGASSGVNTIEKAGYYIRKYDDGNHAIQINWNFYGEQACVEKINQGVFDKEIESGLKYLANYKTYAPIFLRIGAEMNCWYTSSSNYMKPELYRAAYQRIAKKAREICPNVALIFSVNAASYWMADMRDFYPGDAYVDYIGVSAYSTYYGYPGELSLDKTMDTECVQRFLGKYSSMIGVLAEVTNAFPNKPLMITESGCAYAGSSSSTALMQAAAQTHIRELYASAVMVYPQIKSIVYFDRNAGFQYSLKGNAQVLQAYNESVKNNPMLLTSVNDTADAVYSPFAKYRTSGGTMKLSAYFKSVNSTNLSVTYAVDGVNKATCTQYPFSCQVDTTGLKDGFHTLTVKFDDHAGYTPTKTYTFYVKGNEGVTGIHFSDVVQNSWYADSVYSLVLKNVLSGRSETIFDPQGSITRGEFAKILAYASGDDLSKYSGSSAFSDTVSHWSKTNINWAYKNGIVAGMGNGIFAPDAKITREQMAAMICRYAAYKGISLPKTNAKRTFKDDASISGWAKENVYAMQQAGIIVGYADGSGYVFKPKGNATRAEASKMISVLLTLK